MNKNHCLNCTAPLSDKFCARCGQKSDTHRITLKHFIMHDLLHGVWHLEKGMLFTLKETFVRPGQAAMDYIGGKRIRYYNIFYLTLFAIGLNILANHYFESIQPDTSSPHPSDKFLEFLSEYVKIILFGVVPILALNAWLVFRRLKLNLVEHFILGGITLLGMILLNLLFLTLNFINSFDIADAFGVVEVITFAALLLFPVWVYGNAVKNTYSWLGTIWRVTVFYILIVVEILLILILIVLALTGKPIIHFNF